MLGVWRFSSESLLLHNNPGWSEESTIHVAGLRNTTHFISSTRQRHWCIFLEEKKKKNNLLFRGRRRHARVHFFAVLSEFSKFYLNQAKKNDSLFRLHWKIHFFIYSNCAFTDNTFSKTVVLLIIQTCDVILYTQYTHKRPIAVIVNVSTLGTLLDQFN